MPLTADGEIQLFTLNCAVASQLFAAAKSHTTKVTPFTAASLHFRCSLWPSAVSDPERLRPQEASFARMSNEKTPAPAHSGAV